MVKICYSRSDARFYIAIIFNKKEVVMPIYEKLKQAIEKSDTRAVSGIISKGVPQKFHFFNRKIGLDANNLTDFLESLWKDVQISGGLVTLSQNILGFAKREGFKSTDLEAALSNFAMSKIWNGKDVLLGNITRNLNNIKGCADSEPMNNYVVDLLSADDTIIAMNRFLLVARTGDDSAKKAFVFLFKKHHMSWICSPNVTQEVGVIHALISVKKTKAVDAVQSQIIGGDDEVGGKLSKDVYGLVYTNFIIALQNVAEAVVSGNDAVHLLHSQLTATAVQAVETEGDASALSTSSGSPAVLEAGGAKHGSPLAERVVNLDGGRSASILSKFAKFKVSLKKADAELYGSIVIKFTDHFTPLDLLCSLSGEQYKSAEGYMNKGFEKESSLEGYLINQYACDLELCQGAIDSNSPVAADIAMKLYADQAYNMANVVHAAITVGRMDILRECVKTYATAIDWYDYLKLSIQYGELEAVKIYVDYDMPMVEEIRVNDHAHEGYTLFNRGLQTIRNYYDQCKSSDVSVESKESIVSRVQKSWLCIKTLFESNKLYFEKVTDLKDVTVSMSVVHKLYDKLFKWMNRHDLEGLKVIVHDLEQFLMKEYPLHAAAWTPKMDTSGGASTLATRYTAETEFGVVAAVRPAGIPVVGEVDIVE